jgi:hypothetical protein
MAQRLMQSIRERSARPEPALDSDDAVPAG